MQRRFHLKWCCRVFFILSLRILTQQRLKWKTEHLYPKTETLVKSMQLFAGWVRLLNPNATEFLFCLEINIPNRNMKSNY